MNAFAVLIYIWEAVLNVANEWLTFGDHGVDFEVYKKEWNSPLAPAKRKKGTRMGKKLSGWALCR